MASWEDLCRGWCSRLVWPARMAQQRRKIKDLGNGKAAKGAKVLKRGEKIEPITQVKGLGITRRKQTSTVRKRKKNHTSIGRLLGRMLVHFIWWEWGWESKTLE